MTGPTAILIGGSFSALPFLQILQQEGYRVLVASRDLGEPCHALADGSISVDYSDKNALLNACQHQDFDCIIPTCNDYSYLSGAYVAQNLGLVGFDREDIALKIHTKTQFKKIVRDFGLRSPEQVDWESLSPSNRIEVAKNKLIVKPDDAFSGIGISVSADFKALEDAILHATNASRNGKFVVEYFYDGTLHSHSCFLRDGRIVDEFIVDEFCTLNSFQVNYSRYPSHLSRQALGAVRNQVEKLASQLLLGDGLFHTQFLWNGIDVQILECMRRCPGDLYGRQMELSQGYAYHFNVIAPYIGRNFKPWLESKARLPVERYVISSTNKTVVSSIRVSSSAGQLEFVPLRRSGESLYGGRTEKAGILFCIRKPDDKIFPSSENHSDCVSIVSQIMDQPYMGKI